LVCLRIVGSRKQPIPVEAAEIEAIQAAALRHSVQAFAGGETGANRVGIVAGVLIEVKGNQHLILSVVPLSVRRRSKSRWKSCDVSG
jgi:hypothetical protein